MASRLIIERGAAIESASFMMDATQSADDPGRYLAAAGTGFAALSADE